ncbi:MAG: hypothetical protein ACLFM4_13655 [Phormidium sp.]
MSIQKQAEVDQAERDRHIQEKQQKLQDHIQAVGVGIAGGAIVASSSGLLMELSVYHHGNVHLAIGEFAGCA